MEEALALSPKNIFTLSELARSLSAQIDKIYSGSYWINAEIIKLNHYPQSGHCYPQLVEKSEGRIVADIRGFILNSRFQELQKRFREVTGQDLSDGMQILFKCKLSFHAVYGLSLNILDIEAGYTLGEMARMRKEAIDKLKVEGIFDRNKRRHLPMLLKRLAIISVETSKGYRDFTEVIAGSCYSHLVEIRIFPALLQGDAAISRISDAMSRIQESNIDFDAVAIIRGGGGETGLDCYDSYLLGRAVSTFPLPVITGIGHATNLTVVEQVAFKNLITPTDLARFVIDRFSLFESRILQAQKSIAAIQNGFLFQKVRHIDDLLLALKMKVDSRIRTAQQKLERRSVIFLRNITQALKEADIQTQRILPAKLATSVSAHLARQKEHLNVHPLRLKNSSDRLMAEAEHSLKFSAQKVALLDPQLALKRGFTISLKNGQMLRSQKELQKGDIFETKFWDGTITGEVQTH